jgi:hypothetical protein
MRKLALTLMVCAYASAASWEKHGASYENQSAAAKHAALWSEISANQTPYGWYSSITMGTIFTESMDPTLHFVGDTFEDSWLGHRKKLIHSVGSVAAVKFQPVANAEGYTGVFEGADYGVLRMSLAKEPKPTKDPLGNFAPGFGLKFLRDNQPSASMVAMFSVEGQDSWNFFKNDFTNHIARTNDIGLMILAKKFATGTPFVQYCGLSDFAKYGQNGKQVADLKFPFQLVFEPTLRNNYPDTYQKDFQDILAEIPAGTLLYKVMAIAEPGAERVHIGDLVMTSKFVKSYFGDRYLFFRHQDIREDLQLRPEWESHLEVASGSAECPFAQMQKAAKDTFLGLFQ